MEHFRHMLSQIAAQCATRCGIGCCLRRTTSPVAPAVILAADANSILYALTDKARIVFSFNLFAIHGFRAL
jgi:hypothetical protein